MVQEVTMGLKCSQMRTEMMMGTVTTRVLTVQPPSWVVPRASRPDLLDSHSLGQRALWQEVAQRGEVGCPGHTAL